MNKIIKNFSLIFMFFVVCACSSSSNSITISINAEQDSGYKWVYSVNEKGIIKEKNSSVEVLETSNREGLINSIYHYTFVGNNDGVAIVTFEYINVTTNDVKYKIIYKLKVLDNNISVEESSGNFKSKVS